MNLSTSAWNRPREFSEDSLWIRGYRLCASFWQRFDLDFAYDDPTDLCTLVRTYVITAVVAMVFAATAWLLWLLGRDFYGAYQDLAKNIAAGAHINSALDDIFIGHLAAMLVLCLVVDILILAALICVVRGVYHFFPDLIEKILMGTLFVIFACVLGLGYLIFQMIRVVTWPVWKPIQLGFQWAGRRPRKERTEPGFWSVAWQYAYGRMHGICFPIIVEADTSA